MMSFYVYEYVSDGPVTALSPPRLQVNKVCTHTRTCVHSFSGRFPSPLLKNPAMGHSSNRERVMDRKTETDESLGFLNPLDISTRSPQIEPSGHSKNNQSS